MGDKRTEKGKRWAWICRQKQGFSKGEQAKQGKNTSYLTPRSATHFEPPKSRRFIWQPLPTFLSAFLLPNSTHNGAPSLRDELWRRLRVSALPGGVVQPSNLEAKKTALNNSTYRYWPGGAHPSADSSPGRGATRARRARTRRRAQRGRRLGNTSGGEVQVFSFFFLHSCVLSSPHVLSYLKRIKL